jgi:N utilization substance protein B
MEFREVMREGRELALKLLYREAVTGLTDRAVPDIEDATPAAREFAELIVSGVREHSDPIDAAISEASEHWDISRMAAVDRSIIRIGVYELMHRSDTAVGPIINEAIDIARKYSGEDCGRFVNGVLDKIARDVRGDPDPSGGKGALRRSQ